MSPRFPTRLHAQAGPIPGLHPCLYAGAWPAAGRSRSATILSGDAAFSPPNGAHPRTQRADPTPTRHRPEHRGTGRSRSAAAPTRQPQSTRQILCAEVLAEGGHLGCGGAAGNLLDAIVAADVGLPFIADRVRVGGD